MPKLKQILTIFIKTILDLLYPEDNLCFICDEVHDEVDEGHICHSCMKELVFVGDNKCFICSKPLELGYLPDKCPDCMNNKHYFKKAISPLLYTGTIKDAIYKYKYGKKSYMYKAFGYILKGAIEKDISNIDIIVPVPLHKSKLSDRGFNQSLLLSKYISNEFKTPLDNKNLIRIKKTTIQNKLHKKERRKNIKNAFKVIDNRVFINKIVLLIDDIFTTGATADECSKVLLNAGAKEVVVLTLTTGRNNYKL
ncbi:ComF family protein [Dethiothermospora halolimnae]|uniref:ComF family protein n=1 Tax=Dethiothermospora halolimnae TaxID=3114390 RepID=UPI003CCBFFA2